MTPGFIAVCIDCRHFQKRASNLNGKPTCRAFPAGIPDSIWLNGNKHTEKVDGDRGITYEKGAPDEPQ